ncbi:MAG TPA: tetratricopeptide repeat protein [Candidatus Megaira endosymbiont of Nemacystus decipiens]|nr:tetratricopeptide repeat protein [Candidatus Megaera endosymbiont of Nemacystus decipiens]
MPSKPQYYNPSRTQDYSDPASMVMIDLLLKSGKNDKSWDLLQYISDLNRGFIPDDVLFKLAGVDNLNDLEEILDPLIRCSLATRLEDHNGQTGLIMDHFVPGSTKRFMRKYKSITFSDKEIQTKLIEAFYEVLCNATTTWLNLNSGYFFDNLMHFFGGIDFDNLLIEDKDYLKKLSSLLKETGNYNFDLAPGLKSVYKKSSEFYEQALELDSKVNGDDIVENTPENRTFYNNLGFTYFKLGSSERGLYYLKKALDFYEEIPSIRFGLEYSTCLKNIGLCYEDLENKSKALKYYKKSHEAFTNIVEGKHSFTLDKEGFYKYKKVKSTIKEIASKIEEIEVDIQNNTDQIPDDNIITSDNDNSKLIDNDGEEEPSLVGNLPVPEEI